MELKEKNVGYLRFMELKREHKELKETLGGVEYGFINSEKIKDIGIPTLLDVAKAKLNLLNFENKYILSTDATQESYRVQTIISLKKFINEE